MDLARRYQCACGYGTDIKRCFVEHRRTHTDERPYVCECGARFRRSNHLASHQKRKIVVTDGNNQKVLQCRPVKKRAKPSNPDGGIARPWKCECGSTFKWHHLLVSHQRGYSCPVKPSNTKPHTALDVILNKKNVDVRLPRIVNVVNTPPQASTFSNPTSPSASVPPAPAHLPRIPAGAPVTVPSALTPPPHPTTSIGSIGPMPAESSRTASPNPLGYASCGAAYGAPRAPFLMTSPPQHVQSPSYRLPDPIAFGGTPADSLRPVMDGPGQLPPRLPWIAGSVPVSWNRW